MNDQASGLAHDTATVVRPRYMRHLATLIVLCVACTPAGDTAEGPSTSPPGTVSTTLDGSTSTSLASAADTTTATSLTAATLGAVGAASGDGFIAHIGCSQTKLAIRGYEDLGGTRLKRYETAGGQISLWSRDGGQYWSEFDAAVTGETITAAWMEICITSGNEHRTKYEDVLAALEVLRSKIPATATVYASGLEFFSPDDACRIAGASVASLTRQYADQLAESGLAERGPDLGPLTPETTTDGCHPNRAGQQIVGEQLISFFGP